MPLPGASSWLEAGRMLGCLVCSNINELFSAFSKLEAATGGRCAKKKNPTAQVDPKMNEQFMFLSQEIGLFRKGLHNTVKSCLFVQLKLILNPSSFLLLPPKQQAWGAQGKEGRKA